MTREGEMADDATELGDSEADKPRPGAPKPAKVFGVVGLGIFTFAFLANVNTTPQLAKFGLGAILLFVAAIVLFLGPTAMASAEMGAGWPRTGGIYVWTRLAFGEGAGFMIIWLEWANFVVAWPGIMGTITLQTAFAINPELTNPDHPGRPILLILVIIMVTWLAAAMALRGLRVASAFAWYSVIAGTVIPAVLLVVFAAAFLAQGNAPAMEVSPAALIPDIQWSNIAFISGALLMFSGIEIAAIHGSDVRDPAKTIPRANLIAVALCFILFAPLTLAIAIIIPSDKIDIVVGLVESASVIFNQFNFGWLAPVFAFMVVTGLIAALVQIINGPSRGLMVAGRQGGNLPPLLQKMNASKMPVAIIIAQASISSVLSLGYAFLGTVQNAWFMFALIQTNMTLIMYILMMAAVVKLRYTHPDVERPYTIPGKKVGLWAVAIIGILVCVLGLLISFSPSAEAEGMPAGLYIAVLFFGTAAFVAMPFVFWIFRKPSWKTEVDPDLAKELI
ncbi:MAG: APC family permease [Candidatus Nanopelagicales bacterium]|nr:APC family permease [Candidatus Nanopelagicales bacterium]MDZ4250041.1 APC family permease [Candidatus Nanopelagicales bacterium]MDZ7576583.1 APC family permease [Candidatus Nanopelagicales bacterium]